MRRVILMMLLAVGGCNVAWAGDVEDGYAAYERRDYATALEKFRIGAKSNNKFAQMLLGTMYENGEGVTQDYTEAMRLFLLVAQQGDVMGQFTVGHMYANGLGVAQNDTEAARWWQLAARQGYAQAQRNLGIFYYYGKGVAQDYVLAHMWSNIAASSGEAGAAEIRDKAANQMTSQQIAEAQKMARNCQAQNFKCAIE